MKSSGKLSRIASLGNQLTNGVPNNLLKSFIHVVNMKEVYLKMVSLLNMEKLHKSEKNENL